MKTIGIKLADGSFYPVLEDNKPSEKQLELTTAHNNQTKVMVDLYRSATCSMDDAEYVDSLQIENLNARPNGEADIKFSVSLDEDNKLSAKIVDSETGNESNTNITLVSRTLEERLVTDEYGINDSDDKKGKGAAVAAGALAAGGLLAAAAAMRDKQKEEAEPEIEEEPVVEDVDEGVPFDDETFVDEPIVEDEADAVEETAAEDERVEIPADVPVEESADVSADEEIAAEDSISESDSLDDMDFDLPEDAGADESVADETSSDDTFTEDTSSDETISDSLDDMSFDLPDATASDETITDESFSEESSSDATIADDTIIDETPAASDDTIIDDSFADESISDESIADDSFGDNTISDDSFANENISDDLPDMDFDIPDDTTESSEDDNPMPDDFFNTDDLDNTETTEETMRDPTFDSESPVAGGLNFDGLYDEETERGTPAQNNEEDVKKKTKVPVIICIICAIICILATLLILFIIPSKYNLLTKKHAKDNCTPLAVEEPAPEAAAVAKPEPEPEPEPEPAVPEAKEDEIVIIEKAEEVVPAQPPVAEEKPKNITYKIKWGDTLWDIADTYYKNPWRYKYIARYNGIKNPDYIISGTKIIIPAE